MKSDDDCRIPRDKEFQVFGAQDENHEPHGHVDNLTFLFSASISELETKLSRFVAGYRNQLVSQSHGYECIPTLQQPPEVGDPNFQVRHARVRRCEARRLCSELKSCLCAARPSMTLEALFGSLLHLVIHSPAVRRVHTHISRLDKSRSPPLQTHRRQPAHVELVTAPGDSRN